MDFKNVWENVASGDKVSLDEVRALVRLEMAPPCSSHQKDVYCHSCLPRLVEALDFIRRVLDPHADIEILNHFQERSGPEYIALLNPTQKNAFAMRFDSASKLSAEKVLFTGTEPREDFKSITLAQHTTKVQVCDAHYIRAFSIRIKEGGTEEYLKRLWNASLTFEIDGEPLILKVKLKDALARREIEFPELQGGNVLFGAVGVKEGEAVGGTGWDADGNDWLGYMLPHRTEIKVTLENVPAGGGLIRIETAWKLELYTTKGEGSDISTTLIPCPFYDS